MTMGPPICCSVRSRDSSSTTWAPIPEAAQTANRMVEIVRKQGVKPHVMRLIEKQASVFQPGEGYREKGERRALCNNLDTTQIQEL